MNWQVVGHKKQLGLLGKSIESGKLAHAYIFVGPAGVGKRTIALKLARELLNQSPSSEYFHPDLLLVDGQDTIKIEQVRELVYRLSLKPYSARYKVAIITQAENMTLEAANAILKVLEEPKPYTVIILVTDNAARLLKTITSRAQRINFGLVANSEYEQLIGDKLTAQQKRLIATLAAGKPGLAIKIASDKDFLEKLTLIERQYKIFIGNDLVEKLKLVSEIAELETLEIELLLNFWQTLLEQDLLAAASNPVAEKLGFILQARSFLDQNVNTKLLFSNLMLQG